MNIFVLYPHSLHIHCVWMSAVNTSVLMDSCCCIIRPNTADTTSASHSATCWAHQSRPTQTPAAHCGSAHVRNTHVQMDIFMSVLIYYYLYYTVQKFGHSNISLFF